jgi:DNA processing protein
MYLLEDTRIVRPSGWHERTPGWGDRRLPAASSYRSVGRADEAFPVHLRAISDAPARLWVRGAVRPEDALAVAVVGSRRATAHGLALAERLAGDLAARGVTIVSGLARGIDSAAHRGALEAGGRTIAVLGCGVDVVYPPENRRLAARITERGAVLSQFAPGMPALAHHFPIRNRLLAALALGVVVVEAAEASGSLITAGHAGDLGREVMAMPGPAGAPSSRGAHRLIRDGAALVEGWEDVVAVLPERWRACVVIPAATPRTGTEASGEAEAVLARLGAEPASIEALIEATGLPAARVSACLLTLELEGRARQLPGMRFVRAPRG